MIPRIIFGVCLIAAVALPAAAQPGKSKVPLGAWTREVDGVSVEFKFDQKQLTVTLKQDGKSMIVESDYGITKDDIIFGRIHKVKGDDGGNGPDVGLLFSFKIQQTDGTLKISDLTGPDNAKARELIQGEYTLKGKKEKD